MRDYLDIGSSPPMEPCAQVGTDDYYDRARRECRAYISLLRRVFGDEPPGAHLCIRSHPHDFGDYLSVACAFEDGNRAAIDYAYRCEGQDSPQEWDEIARQELNLNPES